MTPDIHAHDKMYTKEEWRCLLRYLRGEEERKKADNYQGASWFSMIIREAMKAGESPATRFMHTIHSTLVTQIPDEKRKLETLFFGSLTDLPLFMGMKDADYINVVIRWRFEMGK